MSVKKQFSELSLSFHLSDPMTSMNALRRWCHDLVEFSRKIRRFLMHLLTLLATNDEKGQAIWEMTVQGAIFEMTTEEAK